MLQPKPTKNNDLKTALGFTLVAFDKLQDRLKALDSKAAKDTKALTDALAQASKAQGETDNATRKQIHDNQKQAQTALDGIKQAMTKAADATSEAIKQAASDAKEQTESEAQAATEQLHGVVKDINASLNLLSEAIDEVERAGSEQWAEADNRITVVALKAEIELTRAADALNHKVTTTDKRLTGAVNGLQKRIAAIELKPMPIAINGKDGESVEPRGDWFPMTKYNTRDIVRHDHAAWIAKKPNAAQEPSEFSVFWQLIARDGSAGKHGINFGGSGGGGDSSNADITTGTAAEPLSGQRIVYRAVDGIRYASSDSLTNAELAFGFTTGAANTGETVNIVTFGEISSQGWGLTHEEPIWLGLNGMVTQTPPSSGVCVQVGKAFSADTAHVDIEQAIYLS